MIDQDSGKRLKLNNAATLATNQRIRKVIIDKPKPYFQIQLNAKLMGSNEEVLLDTCNDDQISNLPDEVLSHILSFLPTKYSVRTRILSKRWIQLFTLVPVLDFSSPRNCNSDTTRSFSGFVSWVFNSYNVEKMDTFRYSTCAILPKLSPLNSWISESLRRGVCEVEVSDMSHFPQKLPRGIFTCKTLTSLKINGRFDVEVPDDVCLPCVKTIHLLSDKRVDVCLASRLFQSCPVLEDLYIWLESKDNQVFNISIPTLKSLKIDVKGDIELVLDVCNVEYVEFCGSLGNKFSGVQGFKLLSNASINVCRFSNVQVLQKLVSTICHARHLCFSADTLQAFQAFRESLPKFGNLVHLDIKGSVSSFNPQLLLCLLDKTPHLEVLIVENSRLLYDFDFGLHTLLRLGENVPACVSLHLKRVEFKGFLWISHFKLVEYFLRNGKALETFKILCKGHQEKLFTVREKLLASPKCSRDCQFVFEFDATEDKNLSPLHFL